MVDQQSQGPFEDKGKSRFENFGKRVKKVIAFLNDQVVPRLRQDSSQALHAAADRLRKLAEQLDDGPGSGAR
jgi:bisphosphoglycerate-dependent phosphoglycerate mutase